MTYKQLNKDQREVIQILINKKENFTTIGNSIKVDRTTISKEIKRNRYIKSNFYDPFDQKGITSAIEHCNKLLKPPYVCNPCNCYAQCRKIKYVYVASEAQKKYETSLVSTRQGSNISEEALTKLDNLVTPLIKQGQSVKLIYRNHKDEIPCSVNCLYNYINCGLLSAKNIDLPRRVKYKVRNKNNNKTKKDYSYRIGRTYDDFRNFLVDNPNINVVEMDTVEGIKGGKVLLTMIFRNFNFMIARLLPNKTSEAVKKELDNIEKIIGTELFKCVFKCILTDNGGEFQRPDELETSIDSSKRCWIFYCDANRSDQKAKVEKNHEYIRYIIPKGTSMDNYNQSDINLMMSHINSTAREVLNFAIPYDMASIYLGMDTMKKLCFSKIQPDDIILKPYLINKKK